MANRTIAERLERLDWRSDRMLCNGHVFELEHVRNPAAPLGDDCFRFWKTKPLIDQYVRLWSRFPDFVATGVVELGMYFGGGTAFWFEMIQPDKMVGIEQVHRENLPYFNRYVAALGGRLRPFWSVDQSDRTALRQIVRTELGDRLNLVLDDASHVYEPTKAAFELLFPLMPPGGLYIVEDWAWAHWKQYHGAFGLLARDPTELVVELVEAVGTMKDGPIASLTIMEGFVCIERGPAKLNPDTFSLEDWIVRRPPRMHRWAAEAIHRAKRTARALVPSRRRAVHR